MGGNETARVRRRQLSPESQRQHVHIPSSPLLSPTAGRGASPNLVSFVTSSPFSSCIFEIQITRSHEKVFFLLFCSCFYDRWVEVGYDGMEWDGTRQVDEKMGSESI